jgi:hypothetical protein
MEIDLRKKCREIGSVRVIVRERQTDREREREERDRERQTDREIDR